MKFSKQFIIFGALLVVLSAAGQNFAQWSGALGSTWNNPTSASISRILIDRMNQRMLARRLANKRNANPASTAAQPERTVPAPAAKATAAQMNSAVRFRSTGTRLMVPTVAGQLGRTPAEQKQMSAILTQVLDTFDAETAKNGYKNDVAIALSSFIAMSCATYHGKPLPGDEKVFELRDIIAQLAVENGVLNGVTDHKKQEMYETLVMFAGLAYGGYEASVQGGDAESAKLYRELAGQNIQVVLGVSPDTVDFTDEGLIVSGSQNTGREVEENTVSGTPRNNSAVLHASELVKAFEGNEVRAGQLYSGKRIRIYGTVNSINVGRDGRIALVFKSSITTYGHALCYFNKSQSSKLANVNANDEVTVEGLVKGWEGWEGAKAYVALENCVIP